MSAAHNFAERFILMQALIVRRTPANSKIAPKLLMAALTADNELVREQRPDLYYNDGLLALREEITVCVEEGLIGDGDGRKIGRYDQAVTLRRTKLGDTFLNSLGPRLAGALDEMPMSDVGVLDFLSLL